MIRLRTLGTLDLTRSDGLELRAVLSQPRRVALLAYLAVAKPLGFHRRDRLVALFWPDHDAERARSSLNHAVYFLRRELGDNVLISRGADDIGLNPELLWCDAAAFEDSINRSDLTGALELYRGDLLPAFFPSKAEGFERWLEEERSRLRTQASHAAWRVADESEARGEQALAVHWARRAAELAPFDEVGARRLFSLLDRAGDRAGAVRAYQEFAERMAAELELAPSPETRALIEDIRTRESTNGVANSVVNGAVNGAPDVTRAAPSIAPLEAAPSVPSAPSAWSAPNLAHPSRRRRWALAGSVAAIASLAATFAVPAFLRAGIDPRSVHVAPFVNRASDPAIDALGGIAADRVTQVLSSAGLLEGMVPNERSFRTRPIADEAVPGGSLHLSVGSRAATIVSGELHREAARVTVQAWITDARRHRVAWAVRPISASLDSADAAIEEVSRRVAGAVAALNMPHLASWFPVATSPPTFDAFQEFAEAVALQSRGFDQDAVPHLRRAVALDTTFTWASMQLALAYYNLFEQSAADSIADALNRHREVLNPLQRHWLAWMLSIRAGETAAGYRAMRAAADMAPDRFLYSFAKCATYMNRPSEAIAELKRLGPGSAYAGGPGAYWTLLTRTYHSLGDGENELRAARAARRGSMEPMNALSLEIRALASLGSVDAVRALLDSALSLPMEREPSPLQVMVGIARNSSPAQLMVAAARELRGHGHEAAAQEALGRALDWYRGQPAHGASNIGRRFEIAHAMYLARDWAAADSAFHALAAADTTNVIYLGFLGTIAARRNDETTARRVIAKFDSLRPTLPQPKAVAGYWQAKISAILGDGARALALLTDVWGLQGDHAPHMDFDFERMWGSKGLNEFIRPKG